MVLPSCLYQSSYLHCCFKKHIVTNRKNSTFLCSDSESLLCQRSFLPSQKILSMLRSHSNDFPGKKQELGRSTSSSLLSEQHFTAVFFYILRGYSISLMSDSTRGEKWPALKNSAERHNPCCNRKVQEHVKITRTIRTRILVAIFLNNLDIMLRYH